jgi:hypothetical protein
MSKDFVQIADDVISGVRLLREGAPDLMKAFAAFATVATTSKAIDTKTKELIRASCWRREHERRPGVLLRLQFQQCGMRRGRKS